jgi:cysteine desulfurase/selenocysteine lyase
MKRVYFDNTATSWPKPPCVIDAVQHYLTEIGANPGRSGHAASVAGGRIIEDARAALARLFNCPRPLRIIFCHNATEALNLALKGLLRSGDHVITSSMEHNAMMRPLRRLQNEGIELTVVPCSAEGYLDPDDVTAAIKSNTRMVALIHASNVVGTISPLADVAKIAREHDLLLLADCAQTAGAYPIDLQRDNFDLLAFTGHKALYGLPGTGGLVIGERVEDAAFKPLKEGGTGSRSEFELQPDFLPDKFESGTPNFIGIAALKASIEWLLELGIDAVRRHELALTEYLLGALADLPGISIMGPKKASKQTATVSFTITNRMASDIGLLLDEQAAVLARVGLHCAPAAHKTIGTFPEGTIRFGLGYYNTREEIAYSIRSLEKIISKK